MNSTPPPLSFTHTHTRTHVHTLTCTNVFPHTQVIPGLTRLAMKLLGPCTFTQAALPYIFENVPESYHQRSMDIFERNATVCCEMLKDIPGISPIMPTGAMYMMVSGPCIC